MHDRRVSNEPNGKLVAAQQKLAMTTSLAHPKDCGGSEPPPYEGLRCSIRQYGSNKPKPDSSVESGGRKNLPPGGNPWQARAGGDHLRWMRVSCHHCEEGIGVSICGFVCLQRQKQTAIPCFAGTGAKEARDDRVPKACVFCQTSI